MKVLVFGYQRLSGTAKGSGQPYDFARLLVGNPIQERQGDKGSLRGAGFEQAEVELRKGCEGEFAGFKFPCELELKTEHELGRNGRMQVVCVGVIRPTHARAVG